MTYPLGIINNIIEQSKEQKTEAWLLFQNIRRAFDSVDLKYLLEVLKRVRISEQIITIMLHVLNNRQAQVITEYRLTETFYIERGIEQEDTLSLTLWCLFYDPLISYIAKNYKGFPLSVETIKDLRNLEEKSVISNKVLALAFMDNTVWIAPLKTTLSEMFRDINSFMTNTGIKVN